MAVAVAAAKWQVWMEEEEEEDALCEETYGKRHELRRQDKPGISLAPSWIEHKVFFKEGNPLGFFSAVLPSSIVEARTSFSWPFSLLPRYCLFRALPMN